MIKLSLPLRAACSLVAIALLPSCGGAGTSSTPTAAAPTDQARALEDTLMAHHDRAMAQTEQLFELKTKLTAAQAPATTAPVIAKMQAADQAMMNWMHHYQAPDSAAPISQRLTYLQDQQRQLAGVERRLRGALDSANAALHQLPAAGVTAPTTPATPATK
ncbi:hypothetical protein [Hymenobacter sp. BT559]|uniref:hypothetical protein n=1 Tax=Hymenobacter sp. BT559 TaxID=2795729 RepID=UPI0018ECB1EB|nr:hypothetical protein [Hymenobacter sp. BT559]MBJ6142987.1 hypothetical protein [Hymenobacter sp. BT559]